MIYQGKRIVGICILWLVAAVLAAALPTVSGHCAPLRFIFMGDSRGQNDKDDLINKPVLKAINEQILALPKRPSFVIHGGDQSRRGYAHPHGRGEYIFPLFKDEMKPLTDAGIKLYAVMGNHELYRDDDPSDVENEELGNFYVDNQREFQKAFTDNTTNGPSGYERLAYSFEPPGTDALFVILDCYYVTKDSPGINLDGLFDDTQLTWLENQLKNTKATHKFVFAHAPYYYITSFHTGQNITFTKLWSILDKYRVDLYGCGHTHLYARKAIDSSIAPYPQLNPPVQWKNNVTQLITGTCGASPDPDNPVVDRYAWHVHNNANTYYFSVIDINGPSVTVTSYGGQAAPYQVIDHFKIPPITIPATDLLLLH
ncbi:MAG: metallophosphoesterase family protein [Desulfobaccales bacterium]